MASKNKITVSSTAEYFAKNLQQVGFSSPTKAVLTTVKEALDNALDACEEAGILPDIDVKVTKIGSGSLKNTDRICVEVEDNGPGIGPDDIAKVFGEYLASSKFGKGRCSRGQQGIGISAATTWAMQTTATGATVVSKKKGAKKAVSCDVFMNIKQNKGVLKNKNSIDWDKPHGTKVKFVIDGRAQINGEAGLVNYIRGNIIVNPHMSITYVFPGMEKTEKVERVMDECPVIPDPIAPHPHTMKLGEFLSHLRAFGQARLETVLPKAFSRLGPKVIQDLKKKTKASFFTKSISTLPQEDLKKLFQAIQDMELKPPPTSSVLCIGEPGLEQSILRVGEIDFLAVVTRKPAICDFKAVQVEMAVARLKDRTMKEDDPSHVLRFANRVPLQFDKGACAAVKAIQSVNWKAYGLKQPKGGIPLGPYIVCVSVISPFIKFKNASKETIDASDELVEEIRRGLMQAGQKLARFVRKEHKEAELERKLQYIEKFGPILVETLARIVDASDKQVDAANKGLEKILGRDTTEVAKDLKDADKALKKHVGEKGATP